MPNHTMDRQWQSPSDSGPDNDLPPRHMAVRDQFTRVRQLTEQLMHGLSDADASIQAMPDASPAKWHLAHTTWFFETFVLREHFKGYALFDPDFNYLFNSYYEAEGPRLERHRRGLLSRPSLQEIFEYRLYVTTSIRACLEGFSEQALDMIELGCHHEEQHQELLQTDILYLFGLNPLLPGWWPSNATTAGHGEPAGEVVWINGVEGQVRIGHGANSANDNDGFAFDCERPEHTTWLAPHALADRLASNGEWRAFMEAGGYRDPSLWLADGWAWVKAEGIEAPLYWRRDIHGDWSEEFGPCGKRALRDATPVRHVSYFEADAFARWSGARLPTEAEWESAAIALNPNEGNFLDTAGPALPSAAMDKTRTGSSPQHPLQQMFGELWQWTASAYLPYPGFRPAPGAVGEYNGKFMSGQFVLRGGSCATPRGHVRASYRNFFYPHQRWQFTGVRLAKDL
jgi:ergothioneine biosynthesis protein EgtB